MAASSGAWSFRSGYLRQDLQGATSKEQLHPAGKNSTTTKKTNQIQFNWDNAYFNQQWQAWRGRVWNEQWHLLTNNYCLHDHMFVWHSREEWSKWCLRWQYHRRSWSKQGIKRMMISAENVIKVHDHRLCSTPERHKVFWYLREARVGKGKMNNFAVMYYVTILK